MVQPWFTHSRQNHATTVRYWSQLSINERRRSTKSLLRRGRCPHGLTLACESLGVYPCIPPAQSRKLDLNPWVLQEYCSPRSRLESVASDRGRPVGDGNTRPLVSA